MPLSSEAIGSLNVNQTKVLITRLSTHRKHIEKRRPYPRYLGRGYKAFSMEEIDRFFNAFKPHEYPWKVFFLFLAFTGFRVGEAVKLRLSDINFQSKKVFVNSEKKHYARVDVFPLHPQLETLLLEYLKHYEDDVVKCGGWVFPAHHTTSTTPHLTTSSARNFFGRIREKAGLTESYGEREGGKPGRLYFHTVHSFRHSFARHLVKRQLHPIIIKHLLRHDSLESLNPYTLPTSEDLLEEASKAFNNGKHLHF